MEKVNLAEKLAQFSTYWNPKLVGEVNDCAVKLAKLKGEFVWHHHADEDELFLVVAGRLRIRLAERDVELAPGEFFIVPRGTEHMPVADDECHVLLVEPKGTVNTGNVRDDRTVVVAERI